MALVVKLQTTAFAITVPPALLVAVEFCAKGLKEEQVEIQEALLETIAGARFDERERIALLIDSMVQDVQNDLAEDGKRYASLAACAPWSRISQFEESVFGASGLPFFGQLQQQIGQQEGVRAIARRLKALHEKITRSPVMVIAAAEADVAPALAQSLTPAFAAQARPVGVAATPDSAAPANAALHASAQINHCFAVWPGPAIAEPDAAFVSVLAELLTNEVLHRTIREEDGAYGGQASHALDTGMITMMSYRDPRLSATHADFERAIAWVLESELSDESVEEAIICVLQGMDKPQSPYKEAVSSWSRKQIGVTDAMRTQYRQNALCCCAADLKAAAKKWLFNKTPSRAGYGGSGFNQSGGAALRRYGADIERRASASGCNSPMRRLQLRMQANCASSFLRLDRDQARREKMPGSASRRYRRVNVAFTLDLTSMRY